MIRLALARVGSIRRMVPIIAVIALLTVAVLAVFNSAAAAAPATPHFGPNVMITQTPAYTAGNPSIAVGSDGVAYLAFAGWAGPTTGTDVFFTKSTNARTEVRIAVDPVDPMLIHAVWTDTRVAGNPDIYYANSTDGGLSFNPSSRVNNDAGAAEQGAPAIAVAANRDVHVVWRDARLVGRGTDIYAARSTNRGGSWIYPSTAWVNDDSGSVAQQEPTLAIDRAGAIYVAWTDYRSGTTAPYIYAARSTNGGVSFGANVKVNDDVG